MKKGVIFFGAIFFSLLSLSLVAAQALPAPPITFNIIGDFFKDLLAGSTGEDSMVRVLLVMLLTTVLFRPALNITGGKSGLAFLVAFLVSVIGIKFFISSEMIYGLMLPYGALAIALSAGIPFLLIGSLIATSNLDMLLRKIMWGFMAGSFIMLWWFRWTNIGDLAYIYLGLGILSLAILFFFDSTLRGILAQTAMSNSKYAIDVQIATLNTEIADLYVQYANSSGNTQLQHSLTNQIRAKEHTRRGLTQMRARMP